MSSYVTRKIVIFAIIEAIAVYGFVLALVGRFVQDFYLLSALSLVLLVIEFPSLEAARSAHHACHAAGRWPSASAARRYRDSSSLHRSQP